MFENSEHNKLNNEQKTPSEIRLGMVNSAIERVKKDLLPEELEKLKAIIIYGSVARGTAVDNSDIDIHIDIDPYDSSIFHKILSIVEKFIKEISMSVSSKNIIDHGSMAKLLVGQKYADKEPVWKFAYSRSAKEEKELDGILKNTYLRLKRQEKS